MADAVERAVERPFLRGQQAVVRPEEADVAAHRLGRSRVASADDERIGGVLLGVLGARVERGGVGVAPGLDVLDLVGDGEVGELVGLDLRVELDVACDAAVAPVVANRAVREGRAVVVAYDHAVVGRLVVGEHDAGRVQLGRLEGELPGGGVPGHLGGERRRQRAGVAVRLVVHRVAVRPGGDAVHRAVEAVAGEVLPDRRGGIVRPRAGVVDRVPEAHQPARHVGAREVGVGRRRAAVVGLEVPAADFAGVVAETGQDDPGGAERVVAGVGDGVVHPFFQRLAGRRVGHDHRRLRRSAADDRLVGNRRGNLELGDFGAGRERAAAAVAEELVVDHIVDAERAVGDPADRDVVVHQRVALVDLERLEFHRRRRIAGVVVAVAVVGVEAEQRERHRAGDVLRGRERTRLAARLAGPRRLKPAVEAAIELHPLVVGIGVVAALRLGVARPYRPVLAAEPEEEEE